MISVGQPASQNGQELLTEFMQYGRQRPFEEIVRRYAGMVFNVCLRVTKDKHDAEDATQAVFLSLALQAKRGNEIKALGPWLQQVGRRLSLDIRRSKKRRKSREERHHEDQVLRHSSHGNGNSLPADLDEIKTILHEELNKLPSKYRLPLVLHYFGGMTRDEMAEELGCKPSTLGVRIFRGREMLAGRLHGRGITISLGTFAVMMAYTVKSVVTHAMVSSTSHAASAMAMGHDGMGLVSSRVIGLSRRAATATAYAKLKVAALVLVLTGTSLGAGAKVLGVLPHIDVRQFINDEIGRLIRPFSDPIRIPLRTDATPAPTPATTPKPAAWQSFTIASDKATAPPVVHTPAAVGGSSDIASNFQVIAHSSQDDSGQSLAPATVNPPCGSTSASARPADTDSESLVSAGSVTTGYSANGPADVPASNGNVRAASPPAPDPAIAAVAAGRQAAAIVKAKPASATPQPAPGPGMIASAADDLSVGPSPNGSVVRSVAFSPSPASNASAVPASSAVPTVSSGTTAVSITTVTTGSTAPIVSSVPIGSTIPSGSTVPSGLTQVTVSPTTPGTIQSGASSVAVNGAVSTCPPTTIATLVPTVYGSVIQSPGVLSGWGKIDLAGILDVSGKVIADGDGIDRTLDLTSFSTVLNDVENSPDSTNGWYAQSHGRLSLPLKTNSAGTSFTWGENPQDPTLSMVNSVRMTPLGTSTPGMPPILSLVSPDRGDLPSMDGLNGIPIGLWQVDPSFGSLGQTELTVRYDADLAQALGASGSSVDLWTFSYDGDNWQPVDASTLAVDTTLHTVSGTANDFDYFAATVPLDGSNEPPAISALPTSERAPTVPEPTCITMILMISGILLRRRRRREQNHR